MTTRFESYIQTHEPSIFDKKTVIVNQNLKGDFEFRSWSMTNVSSQSRWVDRVRRVTYHVSKFSVLIDCIGFVDQIRGR